MIEKKPRTGQLKLGESEDLLDRKLRLMSEEMLAKTSGKEVDEKYKHLKPTGYEGAGLGMFECHYCPETKEGLKGIASSLGQGTNLFEGYCNEAKTKYGYLAPFDLTPLGLREKSYLDEDGGTTRIESILKNTGVGLIWTENPLHGAPKEAWEK